MKKRASMVVLNNWEACLLHLLTTSLTNKARGPTIRVLSEELDREKLSAVQAKIDLAKAGLGLLLPGEVVSPVAGYVLAIPNSSTAVAALFETTRWAAAPSSGVGLWKDALRQAPRDIVVIDKRCNRIHLGGQQLRCTLVILKAARACLHSALASAE